MKKMPVLVTFFNRPSILEQLLIVLNRRSDLELFFSCDGPRDTFDEQKIQECWAIVEKYFPNVDQNRKLERKHNLGCKDAMKGNIDWFFDQNEYGLILEDDCIPNEDFFKIVGRGLVDFQSSSKIMCISGSDYLPNQIQRSKTTFRESLFPLIWGWGMWANKWKLYQLEIPDHREIVNLASDQLYGPKPSPSKYYFRNVFNMRFSEVNSGRINTWDYSLTASIWRQGFMSLQSNANLILNSGFGKEATHTTSSAPAWVPTKFGKVEASGKKQQSYENISDMWLAKNVFNCSLKESAKNEIKKLMR